MASTGSLRRRLLTPAFRVGYRLLRVYWFVFRPRKRGVKCVLVHGDEILLVRHTYGRRGQWELPGGGVKRGEAPDEAARREVREELGVELDELTFLGDLFFQLDFKHDVLACFRSAVGELSLTPDAAEIAEARWFDRRALPRNAGKHVASIARWATGDGLPRPRGRGG